MSDTLPISLYASGEVVAAGADVDVARFDVRLRRELTHRTLALSLIRRFMRVVSLHLLDATLVGGSTVGAASLLREPIAARPYLPMVVAVFLLSLNASSSYDAGDARRDVRRILSATTVAVLLLLCMVAFPPFLPFTAGMVAVLAATAFAALVAGRTGMDLLVRQAYKRGIGLRRAVLVGSLDEVGATLREIRSSHSVDHYVVGHLSPMPGQDPSALGSLDELESLLDSTEVQEVLVATALPQMELARVAQLCFERGTALFVVPTLHLDRGFTTEPRRMGDCVMVRLHPARLEMPSLLIKRVFDLCAALLALALLSPVMALIALAIRAESEGPVFYRSQRVGLGGRRFGMWKFRSMVQDAEAREKEVAHLNLYGDQAIFKVENDPRVTRVGRILRRTSLDELPQLLNVVRGEMSLVGPRPLPQRDVDRFEPHHFKRLSVLPGITGPWQVSGRNLVTDFEAVVQMEREYIASWSLLVDLKILAKTAGVVVSGKGAY